jgi:hypothetical protein
VDVTYEPDWKGINNRLMACTVKQLRELGGSWFAGMLGGESTKAGIAREMTSQMRHWWSLPKREPHLGSAPRKRVESVLRALRRIERERMAKSKPGDDNEKEGRSNG